MYPVVHDQATDWTGLEGEELGRAVVNVCRGLWRDDSARRARMLACISRFEGKRLTGLDPSAYRDSYTLTTDGEDSAEVRWNLCRSLVSTATAKIAGSQQPKVTFVASNADWSTRRKAPKLDAFISGLWSTRQEPYSDIWELGSYAFRDAAVAGLGAVKIWSDTDAGKVIHEKIFGWELLVDPQDARYGSPSNLFHHYLAPRAQLRALFPEEASAIDACRSGGDADDEVSAITSYFGTQKVVDSIQCYEWWSLPLGPEVPGKHVLAIDGAILIEDEWTRDSFPFAIIRWDRQVLESWHGTSLVEEIAGIDDEMNEILARISRTVRLTSMGVCYVNDECEVSGDLITNEDAAVIKFSGASPPTYESPAPFSQAHLEYLQLLKAAVYELSGVNQMTATAQKQPGVTANSAIRTLADLQSERFSIAWKAYQSLFIEVARHDIASVRELAEDDPNFAVKWPGNGFLRTIKWKACDLPDDMFFLQIASAPGIKGTPSDRIQTATEHFGSGLISQDAYMAILTYLDLPGEMDRASRQRNVIDQYVDQWLDATPEEIANNTTEDGQVLFKPPIRWMRLEDALLQVCDAYLQAELDGVPDENKDLFLRWIELANGEIEKKQARLAQLQRPPAPPGAPPIPTPQGAAA